MANTRNKNTQLNYKNEKRSNALFNDYNRLFGESYDTQLSGNGLLHGKLPRDQLSGNSIDTESFLYGINSTNLEEPEPVFVPQINKLETIDLYKSKRIIMPEPLVCEPKQRPQFH